VTAAYTVIIKQELKQGKMAGIGRFSGLIGAGTSV
jgi:hypothetical protein